MPSLLAKDLDKDFLCVIPGAEVIELVMDLKYEDLSTNPEGRESDAPKDLTSKSLSERAAVAPIEPAAERNHEFFAATPEAEDSDPTRLLKIESRSMNADTDDSEAVKALKRDDLSVRADAEPTEALKLSKRPLT